MSRLCAGMLFAFVLFLVVKVSLATERQTRGADFDPVAHAASQDGDQIVKVMQWIREKAQSKDPAAIKDGARIVKALLKNAHNAEAAEAATLFLALDGSTSYQHTLRDMQGWGLIRSGHVKEGVESLQLSFESPPGHPDQAGEWAGMFPDEVIGEVIAEARQGHAETAMVVMKMCKAGIESTPHLTGRTEMLQYRLLQILLSVGGSRGLEILQEAKALYSIATMGRTSKSMLLISEALTHVDPSGKLSETFKAEQIRGSSLAQDSTTTKPLGYSPFRETVLHGIALDHDRYSQSLGRLSAGGRYDDLVGCGNLLLLAGRYGDAKTAFDRAYSLASPEQLQDATENLARAMKAEDGTIARSNTWLSTLRPKAPTVKTVAASAQFAPVIWSYTFDAPEDSWAAATSNVRAWKTGSAPFGAGNANDWSTPPRTVWNAADIWLKREFVVSGDVAIDSLRLIWERDDSAEVYINGVLAASMTNPDRKYTLHQISDEALSTIKTSDKNVLAVHCHNAAGDQIIDVGIMSVVDR